MARLGVAYVPEGRGVFPNLTVRENLVMAARRGRDGRNDWTYERVLETFPRLTERLTNLGAQLSGGEQQMLSIGRALMTHPELIILDEATEGLAPLIVAEIWRVIGEIRASGIATLIVDRDYRKVLAQSDPRHGAAKGQRRALRPGTRFARERAPGLLPRRLIRIQVQSLSLLSRGKVAPGQAAPGRGDLWGGEEVSRDTNGPVDRLCLANGRASWPGAACKARRGVGARSALRNLTRRTCPSAANVASCAARPQAEHRSGVGATRRPHHHEPLPGAACRDAQDQRKNRQPRSPPNGPIAACPSHTTRSTSAPTCRPVSGELPCSRANNSRTRVRSQACAASLVAL